MRIEEMCGLADCSVRIVVAKNWKSSQLEYRRGCVINFAHAAWSGSRVGVFVDGGTCQQMQVAYDVSANQVLPFSVVQNALGDSIIKEYGVRQDELAANDGDVFEWATYQLDGNPRRSMDEFRKRYRP